ncbi:protein POOR HOMOLOGOUS SYNAPSIS 1-like [Mercurialis annua]|uniref:protein POOR HOMOLOGOUS SYNAPSIS 1-like n=1 Tax=Mercurialis annua TaxID=3986 RepID=UPI0021603496|nr:protein POOR HOMOLOGOUS SYNAPSIS 1-like [Mercurialis annua]
MAGMEPSQNPNEEAALKNLWLIHYSRFFCFPLAKSKSAHLIPLTKRCTRNNPHGKWLSSSSSSTAVLHLNCNQTACGPVLIVLFQGKVYEEHYISRLIFSWPQVACLSECPVRGSRVVFASYKDSSGQVQKFAMQFSSSSESQTFIKSLKEGLKGTRSVGSELTSPSENLSRTATYERRTEELSNVTALQHLSSNESVKSTCPEKLLSVHGSEVPSTPLPSSFTALLFDKCNKTEEEPTKAPEALCLNTQAVGCATGSPFYDMLRKLETVIHELGGDLSL